MAGTSVTLDDILLAIEEAQTPDDGEGSTTEEIAVARGIGVAKARQLIKEGIRAGRLRPSKRWIVSPMTGRRVPIPSFVAVT